MSILTIGVQIDFQLIEIKSLFLSLCSTQMMIIMGVIGLIILAIIVGKSIHVHIVINIVIHLKK